MRAHNIPSCYRKSKNILTKPPDLALLSTLIGSNYPCLELIFMVPKVFEPLKFDCTKQAPVLRSYMYILSFPLVLSYHRLNYTSKDHFLWYP